MDPLGITASVITILQLTCGLIMYLNDVHDAPEECRQCIIEACNLQSLLISLRYCLEQGQGGDPFFISVRTLNVENGPLDQYLQALNQLHSKIDIGGSAIKRRLAWKFSKAEVVRLLARIERLKTHISLMFSNNHFKLSHLIKGDTTSIRKNQDLQQHSTMMEWLSPIDFRFQKPSITMQIQEGTGQWFLDAPEFKGWLQGSNKILLCTGIPGAGKTMMAAIAVDHLWSTTQTPDVGVASLFCSYEWQAKQNAVSLFAALTKQLLQIRPDIIAPIKGMYDNHKRQGSRPSLNEILKTLQSVCSMYTTVYIVVDALDECSNRDGARDQLIDELRQLQASIDGRLLFTSRCIPEIVQKFQSDSLQEIRANEEDVRRFVVGQTSRLPNCIQRDEKLKQEVLNKIARNIDGMFLLARLYVNHLLDKRTKHRVLIALERLPKGLGALDEAYGEAMKRIDGQLAEDALLARRALYWLTYAQRPLTTTELCHALAIEPNDRALNENNVYDVKDVLSVCTGLVTVDERSTIISLVHYTAQEYLESKLLKWYPGAQEEVAEACLTYLSFNAFRNGRCTSKEAWQQRHAEHALFGYLAQHWSEHVRPVQSSISSLALPFLCDEALVNCVAQAAIELPYGWAHHSCTFPGRIGGLHLTAMYGLSSLTEMLLSSDRRQGNILINSKDSGSRTPLSYAAGRGHEQVVGLLVKLEDVEVDTKDKNGRTPLSWAAENGHYSVVRLLIEQTDVDPDSMDQNGQSPLSWAAERGHEAVVDLLLAKDRVDVNSESTSIFFHGQTPLSNAAKNGHVAVVKLLLAKAGVIANTRSSDLFSSGGRTPLSLAAERGHLAVVKLLAARKDIEIDSSDDSGRTPLSYAAGRGHEAVVHFLVERDNIKVNSEDRKGRTTLSWAANGGDPAVVRLLIEQDSSIVDLKDKGGRTPLSYAVQHRNQEVVQILLEREDVEADSMDEDGVTPMLWAAWSGHEATARLIARRTDVNADIKDSKGQTPLSHAAQIGNQAIAQLLVERDGVEADSKDLEGRTPLSHAAEQGNEAIVQLLLKRVDVKGGLTDNYGRTSIYYAAWRGNKAVVQLLLKQDNCEADLRDNEGRTPLSRAAERGNEAIVQLLLERNDVNPDSKDMQGRTPLSYAAGGTCDPSLSASDVIEFENPWKDTIRTYNGLSRSGKGHEAVVHLLVGRTEVNVDSKDEDGQTPQWWATKNGHEAIWRLLQLLR